METHERPTPIKMKDLVPEGAGKIASLLTERDLKMLNLFVKGQTYAEIASQIISERTGRPLSERAVEDRFGKIVRMTGTRSKDNLIAVLAEEGSIEAEKIRTDFPPEARRAAHNHYKNSGSNIFEIKRSGNMPIKITGRQLDVLRLRALGFPFAEIAEILEITRKTAETHMSMLMRNARKALGIEIHYGKRRGDDVRLLIDEVNKAGLLDPKNEVNFIKHVTLREDNASRLANGY